MDRKVERSRAEGRQPVPTVAMPGRPVISAAVRRVGGALALPQVLADCGLDAEPLLAEFGLSAAAFSDPENLIPAHLIGRLARRAVELGAPGDFGLRIGMQTTLRSMGLLGYLTASAETVGAALQGLVDYYVIQNEAVLLSRGEHDGEAYVGYEVAVPGSPGADQLTFGSLGSLLNFMRELCGTGFRPYEVRFAYPAPADATLFRKVFGPRLRFDCARSELVFEAAFLARRPVGADPILRDLLLGQVRQRNAEGDGKQMADRVARVMRTLMAAGRFSEEEVARCFGMNRRTLARRLRCSGTSYQVLLDDARFELARQLLQYSRAGMLDIAARLGFADAVTFTRAFRRWSATTPARWRREQAAADADWR